MVRKSTLRYGRLASWMRRRRRPHGQRLLRRVRARSLRSLPWRHRPRDPRSRTVDKCSMRASAAGTAESRTLCGETGKRVIADARYLFRGASAVTPFPASERRADSSDAKSDSFARAFGSRNSRGRARHAPYVGAMPSSVYATRAPRPRAATLGLAVALTLGSAPPPALRPETSREI